MAHVLECDVAGPVGETSLVCTNVLDQKRDTPEGSISQLVRRCNVTSPVKVLVDHSVDGRVQRFDPFDRRIDQLERRGGTGRHEFSLSRGIHQ